MKRTLRGLRGRWRSALIVGLLAAAILMVAVLAMQAGYAYHVHRQVAESVLRDYARVVAEEFIRRTAVEVGYQGYYSAIVSLQNQLDGAKRAVPPEPADLAGSFDGRGRPARELVRTLFVRHPATGTIESTGEPLSPEVVHFLQSEMESPESSPDEAVPPPFRILHHSTGAGQRTFIYAAYRPAGGEVAGVVGFEVDFSGMGPWLQRVVDAGPLLPSSLGDGELSNDLLSIRLHDAEGRQIYASDTRHDPLLTTYTPFGDTYSGILDGMVLLTSIHPDAAPRLIIGGLPRSRLPVLLGLLVITIGLLVAAIFQQRRERSLARMRADFVSRVSHELRTPLTQIRMFAETLLLGRDRTEEDRRRALEIVDQEARRLSHLVENILQFSRGDRGAIRLDLQPCDLAELIRDVAEKFLPIARARKVTVVTEGAEEVVCLVDGDAMRQVVLNLLDNAVKFGPADQEVRCGVRVDDTTASLWVDDEGPGIPERDRERVWRRWQRLRRDEEAVVAGTGIGLTVVHDLVSLHGGRAHIEDGHGGGARFVIQLPVMS